MALSVHIDLDARAARPSPLTKPAEQRRQPRQQQQQGRVPGRVPTAAALLVKHGARRAVALPRGRRGRHLPRHLLHRLRIPLQRVEHSGGGAPLEPRRAARHAPLQLAQLGRCTAQPQQRRRGPGGAVASSASSASSTAEEAPGGLARLERR
eukprot:scaffold26928_cov59-Phaeocystis_antarctica.AAC.3